ncbi:MAG: hypothetical protein QM754_00565 [Tepidisphaeraceae bacterium]
MSLKRPSPRLNAEEQKQLGELWQAWRDAGFVETESDTVRRCIRLAYNHRRRSNRLPEVPAIAGDIGGELRRGRPPKQPRPGQYVHRTTLTEGNENVDPIN